MLALSMYSPGVIAAASLCALELSAEASTVAVASFRFTLTAAPDTALIGNTFHDLAGDRDSLEHFMDLIIQYDTELVWKCTAANHRDKVRVSLLAHEGTMPGFNDSGAHALDLQHLETCRLGS